MGKRLTISNRWREWAKKEPGWAYTALSLMAISFAGLIVHLWILAGFWRSLGLWVMIAGGCGCELVLLVRRQWWWASYWGICVLVGVVIWELASYYLGSQL